MRTHRESTVQALSPRTFDSVVGSPLVGVSGSFAVVRSLGLRGLVAILVVLSIILIVVKSELVLELVVESERVEAVFEVSRGRGRVAKVDLLSDSHI